MAFTDNCDLYGAVHEDGVNRFITHLRRQRPSLFNYATADIAANQKLWCVPVRPEPDVATFGNPLFTIMPALPLLGADAPAVGVGFCAQLAQAQIDFHPSNVVNLPAELSPPLEEQRLAISLIVCGGIECPAQDAVDRIPVTGNRDDRQQAPIVLHGRTRCFCLEVYAIGHVERRVIGGRESLLVQLDDMDIVCLEPEGLEASIVCYLKTMVNVVLREKLTIALETLMLSFPLFGLATITLAPTPNPPIAANPAIEGDQVKAFMTMTAA